MARTRPRARLAPMADPSGSHMTGTSRSGRAVGRLADELDVDAEVLAQLLHVPGDARSALQELLGARTRSALALAGSRCELVGLDVAVDRLGLVNGTAHGWGSLHLDLRHPWWPRLVHLEANLSFKRAGEVCGLGARWVPGLTHVRGLVSDLLSSRAGRALNQGWDLLEATDTDEHRVIFAFGLHHHLTQLPGAEHGPPTSMLRWPPSASHFCRGSLDADVVGLLAGLGALGTPAPSALAAVGRALAPGWDGSTAELVAASRALLADAPARAS